MTSSRTTWPADRKRCATFGSSTPTTLDVNGSLPRRGAAVQKQHELEALYFNHDTARSN